MKKILILTYFFPPATFTASFRVYSWARYLAQFGFKPIFITRQWDPHVRDYRDMSKSSSGEVVHETYDEYEVYKLPYKGNWRDKLYVKYGDRNFKIMRKVLTLTEVLFSNYFVWVLPYKNIYFFAKKKLKADPEIRLILASGQPFALFGFCHRLHKKTGIPWVADYRDDWNTSQWIVREAAALRFFSFFETPTEKRWLRSAAMFTTISNDYVERIGALVQRPGHCIMNGFDESDYNDLPAMSAAKQFTLLFNGTLYSTQPVEAFLDAYKEFVDIVAKKHKPHLIFLGLGFEKNQSERIREYLRGYEEYYEITDRFEKAIALQIMAQAHLFLMFSHTNIRGVTSSKIFDYMALKKPVLLYPSDHDVLEQIVTETRCGIIVNQRTEIVNYLRRSLDEFLEQGALDFSGDEQMIASYSRKQQTARLAELLKSVIEENHVRSH